MFVAIHAFLSLFLPMTISLLTLNTGGCSSPLKNASIYTYVKNITSVPDIIFLQETNDLSEKCSCWNVWSSYHPICNPGPTRGSGVTTLLKENSLCIIENSVIHDGHILYVKIDLDGAIYHLYNILIPQDDTCALKAISSLSSHLNLRKDGHIIFGGDFNCTLNPVIDRLCMSTEHRSKISTALKALIESSQLCDAWRKLHPFEQKFSWQRRNPSSVHGVSKARLDRFYTPISLTTSIHSCSIIPCSLSDHSAIYLKIKLPSPNLRGSAFWHLNNSLLTDKSYQDIIIHFWNTWQQQIHDFPNICAWWDFGKSHIKSLTQMYASKVANEKKETLLNINKTIEKLQSNSDFTPDIQQALTEQREELNLLLKKQAKGTLIRSRFQYANEADTSSSFFYNLEKNNSISKTMSRIRLSSGVITEDQGEIKAHVRNFYERLYSSIPTDQNSLETILSNLPRLEPEESENLDAPLTLDEITTAVKQLGNNKSPGLDGLSSEFYLTFWPLLKNDLLSVLQYAITSGNLPNSFHKAVITLIPKKGDPADIANWRPVSLLNNDYKIFAKALANRLKLCIGDIIHHDQSYCVPGRTIYDNIILIRDVIHFANCNNFPLAIVNLDQKKAFDNVDHHYLFSTMKAMGIGDFFISCVKLLYKNAEGLVKVCRSLSAPFPFRKGIRQGCPMSGLLYSIAIEPFLHLSRQNLRDSGFTLPNTGTKVSVSAYADDISIFVSSDSGFDTIERVYNIFSTSSNACLNHEKSQGLWLGSWSRRSENPLHFKWNNEGLTFLGVHLGTSNTFINQNWMKCKEKLNKTLTRWTSITHSLSLKGKILVANQLAASKIFHHLATLSPPKSILTELQEMLINFVWSNKRHLLKKQILYQEPNKGGLGLVCLQARVLAFRFAFLQRFLNLSSHPAYALCSYNLKKYKRLNFDFQLFLIETDPKYDTSLPCFYSEVLSAWRSSGAHIESSSFSVNHVLNIPLNYTLLLSCDLNGTMVLPARLFARGIKLVKHLLNLTNGKWLPAENITLTTLLRPSVRLLELELSWMHKKLSNNFPAFFCSNGLRLSGFPLHHLAANILSPYTVKANDNTNFLITSTKRLYHLFNVSTNSLPISSVTHWHDIGILEPSCRVAWSEIYQVPASKKDGDVQFKLLYNVLPSLAVLHHMNPNISSSCGWCGERGTTLHLLFLCPLIQPALGLLHHLLSRLLPTAKLNFELYWTLIPRVRGRCRETVRLSNFLIISLKSTLYWLYRTSHFVDPLPIWTFRIKNKIILDFEFYKLQNNLCAFIKRWSQNNSIFFLDNNTNLTWLI